MKALLAVHTRIAIVTESRQEVVLLVEVLPATAPREEMEDDEVVVVVNLLVEVDIHHVVEMVTATVEVEEGLLREDHLDPMAVVVMIARRVRRRHHNTPEIVG